MIGSQFYHSICHSCYTKSMWGNIPPSSTHAGFGHPISSWHLVCYLCSVYNRCSHGTCIPMHPLHMRTWKRSFQFRSLSPDIFISNSLLLPDRVTELFVIESSESGEDKGEFVHITGCLTRPGWVAVWSAA